MTGEEIETEIIYSDEEDYEEYIIAPTDDDWGEQYTPDGKRLGTMETKAYTDEGDDYFNRSNRSLYERCAISGKNWWTTRMHPPLKVASNGATTKAVYNMSNKPYWHDFLDTYMVSHLNHLLMQNHQILQDNGLLLSGIKNFLMMVSISLEHSVIIKHDFMLITNLYQVLQ